MSDRTRSEYRLSPLQLDAPPAFLNTLPAADADRRELADLMLDAYRGTIDDEGESIDDARAAVDHALAGLVPEYSFVVVESGRVVAMAFITVAGGMHYVDPIVVASSHKRTGLGAHAVRTLLRSLMRAGVTEAGATITDGNVASEALFRSLGFVRWGPWPASEVSASP